MCVCVCECVYMCMYMYLYTLFLTNIECFLCFNVLIMAMTITESAPLSLMKLLLFIENRPTAISVKIVS